MYINIKSITERADEIFKAKMTTGKYDQYDDQALNRLYSDCVTQCAIMGSVNSRAVTA